MTIVRYGWIAFMFCVGMFRTGMVLAGELPQGILDFDRQVAFTRPLLMSVFRAYGDDHTYFVLPNSAMIDKLANGSPKITLLYEGVSQGRHALMTINGTIGFANDYATAVAEISQFDSAAKFIIPEPAAFSFTVHTPGSDTSGAAIDNAKIDSSGHFELLVRVANITTRIMLIPESYKFESLAVVYSPTYRGVIRSADGIPAIGERTYNIGVVGGGACALSPERYVSWMSNKPGCIYPKYRKQLVRSIQKPLKKMGLYQGTIDGLYGPLTNKAIRLFQRSRSTVEDGLPTLDLAEELEGAEGA
jgi:hypothetical protein